ncbi:hypothetical protein FKP32DRAFT_1678567 [Trametes sanguinea]|nr:hypothetical protein FKP32DRAFT_1678567 [Trametes sanguinea]
MKVFAVIFVFLGLTAGLAIDRRATECQDDLDIPHNSDVGVDGDVPGSAAPLLRRCDGLDF